MGMPISLAIRGRHATTQEGEAAWRTAIHELRAADEVFSTFRSDSWISRLDRGDVELTECPRAVAQVFEIAEQARIETRGAFDIWRPDGDRTTRVDPSGIVKGWAVERASKAFDGLDESDICLSAGGDMTCRTRVPGSPGWRIGIEDPRRPSQTIAVVPITNGAIATSGTAHRGSHIVDPRTRGTPNHFAAVTVIGQDLTWVDIEATAAFVLGSAADDWLKTRGRSGVAVLANGEARLVGRSPS
jgi:thiamine biosynthesis lipoprotein